MISSINLLSALLWPVVAIAAMAVIGALIGPRAGAGRGRMWAGLIVLIIGQVLNGIWAMVLPALAYRNDNPMASLAVLSLGYGIVSAVTMLTGIALLASAAAVGRTAGSGYLDPNRPGAAPGYGASGYQGPGYPPAGGASPYLGGSEQPGAPPR